MWRLVTLDQGLETGMWRLVTLDQGLGTGKWRHSQGRILITLVRSGTLAGWGMGQIQTAVSVRLFHWFLDLRHRNGIVRYYWLVITG